MQQFLEAVARPFRVISSADRSLHRGLRAVFADCPEDRGWNASYVSYMLAHWLFIFGGALLLGGLVNEVGKAAFGISRPAGISLSTYVAAATCIAGMFLRLVREGFVLRAQDLMRSRLPMLSEISRPPSFTQIARAVPLVPILLLIQERRSLLERLNGGDNLRN